MSLRHLTDPPAWLAIACAAALLLTQLVEVRWDIVAAAHALTPFFVPALALLAVVAMVTDRPAIGFAAAAVGIGYLAVLAPAVFPGSGPEPAADEPVITIVTANLLYTNDRIADVGDALAAIDADVVALSEVTPELIARLRSHVIADDYPHRIEHPASGAGGMLMWSRIPLGPDGPMRAFGRGIDTTVLTGSGAIRMLAVHPPPPVFDQQSWRGELDEVGRMVGETLFPTVVLGDFNATVFHPPFRRMVDRAGLRGALGDVGRALTPTWPTDRWFPPLATLDHVLLDDELATLAADVVAMPGSDHRAIVATITFARGS